MREGFAGFGIKEKEGWSKDGLWGRFYSTKTMVSRVPIGVNGPRLRFQRGGGKKGYTF